MMTSPTKSLRTARFDRRPIELPALSETPLVSVLIINFNYEEYIEEAIQSALDQTYQNIEVVVVDDVSTDDSVAVVQRIIQRDPRVKLYVREANGKMGAATNTAYSHATGDIICLLDSDDWYRKDKVSRVVEMFRSRPDTGFIVHPMVISNNDKDEIQVIPFLTGFEEGWIEPQVRRRGGRWQAMPTSALSMRGELAEIFFPLPEEALWNNADGFMYSLAPLFTCIGAIGEPLTHYRIHDRNWMSTFGRDLTVAQKETDAITRQITSANQRLEELGLTELTINLRRNLNYQHGRMLEALLRPDGRILLSRRWMKVTRMLMRDDVFPASQRILRIGVYSVAILLPVGWRSWWLTQALGFSRAKRYISGVAKFVRGQFRRDDQSGAA